MRRELWHVEIAVPPLKPWGLGDPQISASFHFCSETSFPLIIGQPASETSTLSTTTWVSCHLENPIIVLVRESRQ